jgi:hypothetical protein
VEIIGITFAGTSTNNVEEMTTFLEGCCGLQQSYVDGVSGSLYRLSDGSSFLVAEPGSMGDSPRSIGFLVSDLTCAAAEIADAGYWVGPISSNELERYCHFRAPDEQLYELVEKIG